ncbi:Spy/CpxP family protein refolding chaperone [Candidatus Methylomirabilis sp.]|uniref:Spy/CpxP family protein refolding chaperone n=1 Tax=Candidatus Methylomirabilis sp. TaxID=2032687 RepID=UPI002A5B1D6C|nr:Spy/CpxP family protein refolding chaperone [Candidatus Methylomirabilis sp.]
MRAIVIAALILVGVLGPAIPPMWNHVASAEEGAGGPGMTGYRMIPEMMRGMGIDPSFHRRGGHEWPLISQMLMWQDQLGLTADQERTLRELRANFEKESIKRTAEIDVAELELNGLLEQDKVDVAKVETLAKKSAMLQAELRVSRVKTIEAGKAVLTPEQAEKFERLGHEWMMGGMGMRMPGPGMPPPMRPGTR